MTVWVCPEHGVAKTVPAGVSSKTGKPYPAFLVCSVKGCEQRPPKAGHGAAAPGTPVPAPRQSPPATKPAPNWDRIAEGKCRSLAICAWIQAGKELEGFWEVEKDVIRYMMAGTTPFTDGNWETVDGAPFPEE